MLFAIQITVDHSGPLTELCLGLYYVFLQWMGFLPADIIWVLNLKINGRLYSPQRAKFMNSAQLTLYLEIWWAAKGVHKHNSQPWHCNYKNKVKPFINHNEIRGHMVINKFGHWSIMKCASWPEKSHVEHKENNSYSSTTNTHPKIT